MTGREVMDNLRRAITAVAEYRNNNETINNNENLRKEAYVQTQKLRDAWSELEKIFGLRRVSVKIGDLTLTQVNKICVRYSNCENPAGDLCPFYDSNKKHCNPTNSPFYKNKVVYVLEEDLK